MKIRTHSGQFLKVSAGKLDVENDYSNDVPIEQRENKGSDFSAGKQSAPGSQGILADGQGKPVVFEHDGKTYKLKLVTLGDGGEQYALKAVEGESNDTGLYLTVGIQNITLEKEPTTMSVFSVL